MHPHVRAQLADRLKPALVGLTQSLVFRRARRVCFGYVKGSAMKRLNRTWREKVRRVAALRLRLGWSEPHTSIAPHTPTAHTLHARAQMLQVRRLSPQALGVPDAYVPRDKAPYQETSNALAEMALCLTPQVS